MKARLNGNDIFSVPLRVAFIFLCVGSVYYTSTFVIAATSSSSPTIGVQIDTSIPPTPLPPPPPPPEPIPEPIPEPTPVVTPVERPSRPIFALEVFDTYRVRVSGVSAVAGTIYITTSGTSLSGIPIASNVLNVTVGSNGLWRYETNALNAGRYQFVVYVSSASGESDSTVPRFVDIALHSPSRIDTSVIGGQQLYVVGKSFPSGDTRIKITRHGFSTTVTDSNDSNGNFSFTSDELSPGSYSAYFATVDQLGSQGDWSDAYTFVIPEDATIVSEANDTLVPTTLKEEIVPKNTQEQPLSSDEEQREDASFAGYQEDAHVLLLGTIGSWIGAINALIPWGQGFVIAGIVFSISAIVLVYVAKRSLLSIFGSLFAKIYKRKKYGIVYDGVVGSPIALAKVCLRDSNNQLIDVQITNALGMYSFSLLPGQYQITVEKEGYTVLSFANVASELQKKYQDVYTAGTLFVTQENFVGKNIPLIRVR